MEVEVFAKFQSVCLWVNPDVDGFVVLESAEGEGDFNKTLEHTFLSTDGVGGDFLSNYINNFKENNTLEVSSFDSGEVNAARNIFSPEGEGLQAGVAETIHYTLDSHSLNQTMVCENEITSSDLPCILKASDNSRIMSLLDQIEEIEGDCKDEDMDLIPELIADISLNNLHSSVPLSYLPTGYKNNPIQSDRNELGSAITKRFERGLVEHTPEFQTIFSDKVSLADLRLKLQIGPSTSVDSPIFDELRLDQGAPLSDSRSARLDRLHAPIISKEKVVYQVATALTDCAVKADGDVVELLLAPKELGACRFRMVLNGNRLEVDLAVDNPNVLQLMRRQVDILIFELKAAGFNQTSINFSEMKNGDTGFSQSRRDDQAAHRSFDPDVEPDASLMEVVRQNSTVGRLHLKL